MSFAWKTTTELTDYWPFCSEDYYGELDLKGLRDTEVQAGLAEAPKSAKKKAVSRRPVVVEDEADE